MSVVGPRVLNRAIKDANVSISQCVRVRKCTSACACILLCDALGIVLRRIMSTSTELAFALYELGLLSYAGKLRTAGVNDVRKLAEVDEEKLIAAGIEKVGPRRKLLNAAAVRRERDKERRARSAAASSSEFEFVVDVEELRLELSEAKSKAQAVLKMHVEPSGKGITKRKGVSTVKGRKQPQQKQQQRKATKVGSAAAVSSAPASTLKQSRLAPVPGEGKYVDEDANRIESGGKRRRIGAGIADTNIVTAEEIVRVPACAPVSCAGHNRWRSLTHLAALPRLEIAAAESTVLTRVAATSPVVCWFRCEHARLPCAHADRCEEEERGGRPAGAQGEHRRVQAAPIQRRPPHEGAWHAVPARGRRIRGRCACAHERWGITVERCRAPVVAGLHQHDIDCWAH